MKKIPPKISLLYDGHPIDKAIPKKDLFNYRKWLRYYLDFCLKHKYNHLNKNSLNLFMEKLKEKIKNEQQQKQAFYAISLYYELDLIDSGKDNLKKILSVYNDLNADIKLGHYLLQAMSPAKPSLWTEAF